MITPRSLDFSDIRYNVRSYSLTAVLLIVSSDRIAVAFNWSGATQAVISKTFNRDWGDGLPLKLKFYRVGLLALFCYFIALDAS